MSSAPCYENNGSIPETLCFEEGFLRLLTAVVRDVYASRCNGRDRRLSARAVAAPKLQCQTIHNYNCSLPRRHQLLPTRSVNPPRPESSPNLLPQGGDGNGETGESADSVEWWRIAMFTQSRRTLVVDTISWLHFLFMVMHNRQGRAADGRQGAPVGKLFHMHVTVYSWWHRRSVQTNWTWRWTALCNVTLSSRIM